MARCTATLLATTVLAPVLLLGPLGTAHAADNVISTIVTDTNGTFSLDGADSLTITSTGGISTTGNSNHAIVSTNNGNTFINQGAISSTGRLAYGINLSSSDNNIITHSGSISTTGRGVRGIFLTTSDNNIITHSGSISIMGGNANGIFLSAATTIPSPCRAASQQRG